MRVKIYPSPRSPDLQDAARGFIQADAAITPVRGFAAAPLRPILPGPPDILRSRHRAVAPSVAVDAFGLRHSGEQAKVVHVLAGAGVELQTQLRDVDLVWALDQMRA